MTLPHTVETLSSRRFEMEWQVCAHLTTLWSTVTKFGEQLTLLIRLITAYHPA